jgi:hypothetical protein
MTSSTRSESALVRPFAGIEQADAPLDDVRLTINETVYLPGAVVLPEEDLATATIAVTLPDPSVLLAAVKQTVVPDVDCGLVVFARGRTHRTSHVLLESYVQKEDYDTDLMLDRGSADLIFNDRAGFVLTIAVVLMHDLTAAPLRPHMAGTWLARRDFRVGPEEEETSFSPEALTAEIRDFYGLPAGTLRYVQVEGALDADDLSEVVHVYVDPEVLNLLLANSTDSSAIQMQIELAIQATETVAQAISRDLSEGGSIEPSPDALEAYPGPLGFFQNLARTLDTDVSHALSLAAEPNRLRAFLEAAFEMRTASATALKEK